MATKIKGANLADDHFALKNIVYLATVGSGTYTTPTEVRALRVTCVSGAEVNSDAPDVAGGAGVSDLTVIEEFY